MNLCHLVPVSTSGSETQSLSASEKETEPFRPNPELKSHLDIHKEIRKGETATGIHYSLTLYWYLITALTSMEQPNVFVAMNTILFVMCGVVFVGQDCTCICSNVNIVKIQQTDPKTQ